MKWDLSLDLPTPAQDKDARRAVLTANSAEESIPRIGFEFFMTLDVALLEAGQ